MFNDARFLERKSSVVCWRTSPLRHTAQTILFLLHIDRYKFTTYQDARRVRFVDGLIFETNIIRVSPVKSIVALQSNYLNGYVDIVNQRNLTKFVDFRRISLTYLRFLE